MRAYQVSQPRFPTGLGLQVQIGTGSDGESVARLQGRGRMVAPFEISCVEMRSSPLVEGKFRLSCEYPLFSIVKFNYHRRRDQALASRDAERV